MKIRDTAPTSRVMLVAVMVSMVAFLDSTVVNLALPATTRDLGGGMGLQQWVVDGYLLGLGAMILPGGLDRCWPRPRLRRRSSSPRGSSKVWVRRF